MAVKQKFLEKWRMWMLTGSITCVVVGGAFAFCWNTFAGPDIERRIDEKLNPVAEALVWQNYLYMEYYPDSVIERATEKFAYMKKHAPK